MIVFFSRKFRITQIGLKTDNPKGNKIKIVSENLFVCVGHISYRKQ
jgi:hypothetical protein